MPEKHQQWTMTRRAVPAMRGPQVVHLAVTQMLDMETRACQSLAKQRQAAGVIGRHRAAADQVTGKFKHSGHGYSQRAAMD